MRLYLVQLACMRTRFTLGPVYSVVLHSPYILGRPITSSYLVALLQVVISTSLGSPGARDSTQPEDFVGDRQQFFEKLMTAKKRGDF